MTDKQLAEKMRDYLKKHPEASITELSIKLKVPREHVQHVTAVFKLGPKGGLKRHKDIEEALQTWPEHLTYNAS